jgi:hypothetical protein
MASALRLRRLVLGLAAALALASCKQRPEQAPVPTPPSPPSPQAPAPAPPELPAAPPAAEPAPPLSDAERDAVLFTLWRARHGQQVEEFEAFLVREQVAQVVPTYQLLRSASMWKECRAEPFELPPLEHWMQVRDLLILLRELKNEGVLPQIEVVSAYRDPRLNRCAGGAPGSSHQQFAVDIAPLPEQHGQRLCRFWRDQGRAWEMGVSRYPSGRIHIDRSGYRTWGASHKRGSSYCLAS